MSLGAPWAGQPNKISVEFCMCKGGGRASILVLTCRVAFYNSCNERQFTDQQPHVYNGFLPGMLCQMVPKYLRHGYM